MGVVAPGEKKNDIYHIAGHYTKNLVPTITKTIWRKGQRAN